MKYVALAAVASLGVIAAAFAYSGEHYTTCHLDPNGDNWLALKAGPDINAARIAKLGPNVPLLTSDPDPVGNWRRVHVLATRTLPYEFTGDYGWVHTGYICVDTW